MLYTLKMFYISLGQKSSPSEPSSFKYQQQKEGICVRLQKHQKKYDDGIKNRNHWEPMAKERENQAEIQVKGLFIYS